MNRIEKKLFEKFPETQVTFINKQDNVVWDKWKKWKECSEEEKTKANLRQIFPEEVVLDFENKEILEESIKKLKEKNFGYEIYDSGSRGIHIHIFLYGLENYSLNIRNQIRKKIIKVFGSDESKSSEATLVARFNKPHFKTMKEKTLIESCDKFSLIPKEIILELREENLEGKEFIKNLNLKDENFKNFHLQDPMFKYIQNNIIPENTSRDINIFPSIAMGLVKEGLDEKQIEDIMKPIIETNFPGKIYAEFKGWVNKALKNEVDWNPIQLNNWIKEHTTYEKVYNLDPIKIALADNNSQNKIWINLYDYLKQPRKENKWLIQDWISEGDIVCIYGKPGSYKSTIVAHMCYAISTGDLVFNKYETQQAKILYLNAENHHSIMIPLMERVIKGMEPEESQEKIEQIKNHFFITEKKAVLSLENPNDVLKIINIVKEVQANVIVFDSFRRFFVGKENDSDIINKMFIALEKIRTTCNDATIILIHHARKDSQDQTDFRDMARGSGDIIGMVDCSIYARRQAGQNSIILSQTKNRGGEELVGKKIMVEKKDNEGLYMWETKDIEHPDKKKSVIDIIAEEILKLNEEQKLQQFTWKELVEIKDRTGLSHNSINATLRNLKTDGTIEQIGNANKTIYIFKNT